MKKIKIILILMLFLSVGASTYCAFLLNTSKNGTITTKELSTKFVSNSELLTIVKRLYSSITSIDKSTDLVRVTTRPQKYISEMETVSTYTSSVPIYLWVENGVIYYYTIAVNIDFNNN